jgi:hypothetical protein
LLFVTIIITIVIIFSLSLFFFFLREVVFYNNLNLLASNLVTFTFSNNEIITNTKFFFSIWQMHFCNLFYEIVLIFGSHTFQKPCRCFVLFFFPFSNHNKKRNKFSFFPQ